MDNKEKKYSKFINLLKNGAEIKKEEKSSGNRFDKYGEPVDMELFTEFKKFPAEYFNLKKSTLVENNILIFKVPFVISSEGVKKPTEACVKVKVDSTNRIGIIGCHIDDSQPVIKYEKNSINYKEITPSK